FLCKRQGRMAKDCPNREETSARNLSRDERSQLQNEGRCFLCKRQGHMARSCPNKGRSPRRTVPTKRKARITEAAEGSSDEERSIVDDRSSTSEETRVSVASRSKRTATSRIRTTQLTLPTIQSMIGRLSNEEKQEVFDGFI